MDRWYRNHGKRRNRQTAVMLSNYFTKNPGFHDRAARLLNIKFDPSTVAGEEGTKKLASFIRTWCDLKLWHVQFNVINKETLIAAKENHYLELIRDFLLPLLMNGQVTVSTER